MLGWLLGSSARTAILQSDFSDRLEGITVADLMDDEPVTIPPDTPAERAYEDFFLRYQGWEWFAVVDRDDRFAGIAHREPRARSTRRATTGRSASSSCRRARTARCAPTRRSRCCSPPSRCAARGR